MRSLHALCVHGVGSKTPAKFADKAMKWLSGALSKRGVTLYARSVHWGPIMDKFEEAELRAVAKLGSSNKPVQRAAVGLGGDATSYEFSRDAIHAVFDYEALKLRADGFVIFAHSLGCLIATDWLRTRDLARCAHLYTMGNNLRMFNMGRTTPWPSPKQVALPGTWTNFFDPEDGLGWPVSHWIPQVYDVKVEVGGFLARIVPSLSHTGYWSSKEMWQETVPQYILGG